MTLRFSSRTSGIALASMPRRTIAALARAFSISVSVSPNRADTSCSRVCGSTSSRTSGRLASRSSCMFRMADTSHSSGSGRSIVLTSFSSAGISGNVGPTNRTVTGFALIAQASSRSWRTRIESGKPSGTRYAPKSHNTYRPRSARAMCSSTEIGSSVPEIGRSPTPMFGPATCRSPRVRLHAYKPLGLCRSRVATARMSRRKRLSSNVATEISG